MKILFITRFFYPHIGGVEKHVLEVGKRLNKRGHEVVVLTENYSHKLKSKDKVDGIDVVRFSYPHIKYLGLAYIWLWLFKYRKLIRLSDVVHCHDVFLWYLPFRFIYFNKPVFTTFHGWEGDWPIPKINILLKQLSNKLSWGSIGVGKYLEKYFKLRLTKIIYGAV